MILVLGLGEILILNKRILFMKTVFVFDNYNCKKVNPFWKEKRVLGKTQEGLTLLDSFQESNRYWNELEFSTQGFLWVENKEDIPEQNEGFFNQLNKVLAD